MYKLYMQHKSFLLGAQIWIGGFDMFNENIHRWLDGSPCMPGGTQYTNWSSDNPDNGHESHVTIRMDENGRWGDTPGTSNRKYVCEPGLI